MLKNLILVLSLTLLVWALGARAEIECEGYLDVSTSAVPKNVYSMLGRKPTYTVEIVSQNFARRFINGVFIKDHEIEYVINYFLNKQILSFNEAQMGLDMLTQYAMSAENPLASHSEFFLSSFVKLNLKLFYMQPRDYEKYLREAGYVAREYMSLYPESEKAKALVLDVNKHLNLKNAF